MIDDEIQQEVPAKDLELVRDIIRAVTKTAKAFNVYPKDNPIYQKFIAELTEKFNAFFQENDELSLGIEQHSLLYQGEEVYHNGERTENLALLLFADGIRQLTFYRGLTPDEITDFIDILRTAPRAEISDEDDIVTLLWEKNIRNMGYTAVEDTVDDDLVVEETFFFDAVDAGDISEQDLSAAAPAEGKGVSPVAAEPLTEAELAGVRDEINGLDEKAILSSAVALFFELLSSGECKEAFADIVQTLGKILDARMQRKDIEGAVGILEELRRFDENGLSEEEIGALRSVSFKAGCAENLKTLFAQSSDNAEVRQYLMLLDESSLPDMIQILGELSDRRQRRLLCEVLAELGRNDPDSFSDAVSDPRWYLVRNTAMILGMTKEPAAVKYLEKTLRHTDLRVRRETVRALDAIQSDETRRLFLIALGDTDVTVRTVALKALRRFRDPSLFESLKKGATREELKKKSFDEKRAFLETLAVVGGMTAFPLLSDLFQKKGLIEKDEATELRAAAAYGLGHIGSPEAAGLLEKESGARKNILREACIRALRESQHSGNDRR